MVSLNGNNNNLPRLVDRTGNLNVIKINGKSLYFGGDIPEEELLSYSLPPVPPEGATDIRFSDDMRYCIDGCVIESSGLENFLIDYNIIDASNWILISENKRYELNNRGKLNIKNRGNLILKSK